MTEMLQKKITANNNNPDLALIRGAHPVNAEQGSGQHEVKLAASGMESCQCLLAGKALSRVDHPSTQQLPV